MPHCCRSIGLNSDLNNFGFLMLANANNFFIAMLIGFTIASSIAGEVGPAVLLPVLTSERPCMLSTFPLSRVRVSCFSFLFVSNGLRVFSTFRATLCF